jgi:ferredoxin-type protein NapH
LANKYMRKIVQFTSAFASNGYLKGFATGKIYKGDLKRICVPGLNCYSCPGAVGACPIGALQSVIGSIKYNFSFYVIGFMTLIGVMLGRFICGWMCPFGLIQELLHKIPFPKIKVNPKVNNVLKYMKYVVLAVFVILLPLVMALGDELGVSDPYFCKLICPAGTLEGGIPLVLMNKSLQSTIGLLYAWKVSLMIVILLLCISIYRMFCRYICPLGAFYALFNRISFYNYSVDKDACRSCSACKKACKLDIDICKTPNSAECIRCGECKKACSFGAIHSGFRMKKEGKQLKRTVYAEINSKR